MNDVVCTPRFNHIAIQTDDVAATTRWYREFLGATVEWSLDEFSELTHDRLPGIRELVELKAGDLRFHVFDRSTHSRSGPRPLDYQFQHVGATVERPEQLRELRERWLAIREAGDYRWNRDEPPTQVVEDPDGMQSLYLFDPNGLEFEFVWFPEPAR